ncbi:MFS transporter [Thalassotalea fonticola]|uniref:MFS transporter n=1 Tax=Thalassotalea fonticola TaxID=3065649 RepID=A0ABZ0GJG9_9GAMM|nr:MFS transporter [Colwelliaceae bacterium S1-1]
MSVATSEIKKNSENNAPTLARKLALGGGFFSLFFVDKGVELLAIPFYQMTLGVDPFLFSLALTIPIIFSAFLSPWAGKLSDNCESRFGRRRPFIVVAAWLNCLFFGLIWMVPEHWSSETQLLYFFITSLLFYLASPFYSVPLTSLSYEITRDVNERIKVMEINSYFIKLASMSSQWLFPLATLTIFSSVFVGIKVVGWSIAILVIAVVGMLPAFFIPDKSVVVRQSVKGITVLQSIRTILSVPLMRLIFVIVFIQLGCAAYAARMDYYILVYYMNDGNISEGAVWKAVLSMGYAIIAAVYIPIVSRLSRIYGKLPTLKVIFTLALMGGIAKWFIFAPGVQWLLLLDPLLCAGIWTAMTIIIPALVAEASNQDSDNTKVRREGVFAALHGWMAAISVMFALLVGGVSLNAIGFDASKGSEQLPSALQYMKYILSLGTAISSLFAILVLHRFQKKHYKA